MGNNSPEKILNLWVEKLVAHCGNVKSFYGYVQRYRDF